MALASTSQHKAISVLRFLAVAGYLDSRFSFVALTLTSQCCAVFVRAAFTVPGEIAFDVTGSFAGNVDVFWFGGELIIPGFEVLLVANKSRRAS
jgi:hypothetical protein